MNQTYLEAITTPIKQEHADCSEENELYAFLDEEMVKFGSLRESNLDWRRAEDAAISLLRDHCKHMRVLAHLAVCLQQSRDGERYLLSIKLINLFLSHHWKSSQPKTKPVSRSLVIKRKILMQILQRTTSAASRLDLTEGDRALVDELTTEIKKLEDNANNAGVEYEEFWKICNDFNKSLPEEKPVQVAARTSSVQPEKNSNTTQQAVAAEQPAEKTGQQITIPELHFDASNEREVKQTLFKVATLLNSISAQEPLGYRVRRFALWFNITSLPHERKDGTTELMTVSADRVIEYQDALKSSPSEELLLMVEHSVAASPFWLSGSHLSSLIAKAVGLEEISDAIQDETLRFTKRLPGLMEAKFSDGTPFADESTRQWLRSGGNSAGLAHGGSGAWGEKLQSALQMVKEGDYKDALMLLEKGTRDAEQPRDKFYWRLATADFMESTGMKSIAREEYRSLLAATKKLSVHTWEPLLINLLRQNAETSDTGNEKTPMEPTQDS